MAETKKDKKEKVAAVASSSVPEVKPEAVKKPAPEKPVNNTQQAALYEEYQPRQVSLLVNRVDPWTVMKMSFLLSIVLGIVLILTIFILWNLLNAMHVFSSIAELTSEVGSKGESGRLVDYLRLPRVMGMTIIVSIMNTVLITALSTVAAIIYNLLASLVGGVKLTLMDD